MKISICTPARKWLVTAVAVALATAYIGLATSQFAAWWLGNPSRILLTSLPNLRRAAWLDPGNAEYRDRLGRFYDLVSRDPASAVGQYRAAVQLNPHSATYWFDLANAYQVLGDAANQTAALERAIQADSMTPDVAWEAANLYLVQGENEKALREFRVVLANDSSLAPAAIHFCWRIEPDVDALLRDVVPPRSDAYIAFLALLQDDVNRLLRDLTSPPADADPLSPEQVQNKVAQIKKETGATFKVWDALVQTHQTFERRYAYEYFQFLIRQKEVDQAVTVWRQTAGGFNLAQYLPSSANLIVDGTFKLPVLNAGFDWQHQKQDGVQLTLESSDSHSGQIAGRSLLIAFDGPGVVDAGMYQLIAVQPNTTYSFSGYYKNDEMEGAGGPHLTIQDMYSQTVYYESHELKDAGFWKSLEGEFTTAADCKLVVLHVRRLPERSPIRGKLWIGDLHLTPKPS
jgi:tetratricopeptide (TPR) repeat protein